MTKTNDLPKKIGPPTKYREEMPQEMLEMMKEGYLNTWICTTWGISEDTFYKWLKEHDELAEAYQKGKPACEMFWEKKGMYFMESGNNKAFMYWMAVMNNKFKWNKGQGAENQTNVHINQMNVINQKSRSELEALIQDKLEEVNLLEDMSGEDVIPNDNIIDAEIEEVIDNEESKPKE